MKQIYIILITLLIAVTASATTYRVKPTGTDSYNGSNWTLAKKSLQNAINSASVGDTILVAVGTYSGGFVMREGITVMGGYTANTPTSRERILPSDATGESQMSILDGEDTQRTLMQITDFSSSTFWDGFVIRNGSSVSTDVAVGSLVYASNGTDIIGIVYQIDGENGKMISLAESKKSWGGYQVEFTELPYIGVPVTDMNGKENTQLIIDKIIEISPTFNPPVPAYFSKYAAFWCRDLSTEDFIGWYLPSVGEWQEIYAAKSSINSILIAANARLANGYWASNHAGELLSWAFYFENGKSVPTLKYIEKNVRAIRSFEKSELEVTSPIESSVLLREKGILNHCIVDGVEVNLVGMDNVLIDEIKLFPNPVKQNESFTITSNNEIGNLQLIDISGKVVFSKNVTGNEITIVSPENPGMYVLRLLDNKTTIKVVVY